MKDINTVRIIKHCEHALYRVNEALLDYTVNIVRHHNIFYARRCISQTYVNFRHHLDKVGSCGITELRVLQWV